MGVEERFLQVLRHPAAGEVGQAGDGVAQLLDLPPAFGAGGQVRFHSHSELRWKIPFEIISQRDLDALAAERLYHPIIVDPGQLRRRRSKSPPFSAQVSVSEPPLALHSSHSSGPRRAVTKLPLTIPYFIRPFVSSPPGSFANSLQPAHRSGSCYRCFGAGGVGAAWHRPVAAGRWRIVEPPSGTTIRLLHAPSSLEIGS